jgi:uncharacterized protein (TIGR03437 family)
MRHLAVLLLAAGGSFAADFITGQAARAVIGQPTFTSQDCANGCDPSATASASANLVGAASGLAYANGALFVADANRVNFLPINNRVLIYRNINQQLPPPDAELPTDQRCPLCVGTADAVLGQPDTQSVSPGLSQSALNLPTGVASDGVHVAVADTNNNRVLIWNSIPGTNQPADVVVGQPDFTSNCPNTNGAPNTSVPSCPGGTSPGPKTLRGPVGVWLANGKLMVADDLNHRVLIWNQIPTSNFASADLVLGQADFTHSYAAVTAVGGIPTPSANTLLNPVGVTTDGARLFVTDLGNNRVLIWNSMPTQNQQPADHVIGQASMTAGIANNSNNVCPSNGTDSSGNPTYPSLCGASLNYPRFALSDGTRLFIADGGNDRVLVFNHIPTQDGATADFVLGQYSDQLEQTSDNPNNPDVSRVSSADAIRNPMGLAWDGRNLYVTDPSDRRVMVFTLGDTELPPSSVRNAASMVVFAVGSVTIGGTITANDKVTITIRGTGYEYTVQKNDTLDTVAAGLVALINAGNGDPWVLASADTATHAVDLTSRVGGLEGNNTTISTTLSTNATITATASGANLTGGQDAARLAPGTLVTVFGDHLSDSTASAPAGADPLPTKLAGTRLYIDGIAAPLLMVSPTQINAQVPWDINDGTSSSSYVRTEHSKGTVSVTNAVAIPVIKANPGIFANAGNDPRPAIMVHGSSSATGTVLIDGLIAVDSNGNPTGGDVVSVTIGDNTYTYTLTTSDTTLAMVRDKLIALMANDPTVTPTPAGQFTRIRLAAREQGPAAEGIPISAKASRTDNGSPSITMGTTNTQLCCSNIAGAEVTTDNPAVPGEVVVVYGAGLGFVAPDDAKYALYTGFTYKGPLINYPNETVSSLAGGKTANVLFCGLKQNEVGVYEVDLELNTSLLSDNSTQMTIAQDIYVSNIVTFPVVNNAPPSQ